MLLCFLLLMLIWSWELRGQNAWRGGLMAFGARISAAECLAVQNSSRSWDRNAENWTQKLLSDWQEKHGGKHLLT